MKRISLNPIMLSLLAALAAPAEAVEHGQITLTPPTSENVNTVLNSGDTVTLTTAGNAITVGGTNKVSGDGVTVAISDVAAAGLVAVGGGVISLTDSTISATNATGGWDGRGTSVYASGGGRIQLEGGSVTTNSGHGIVAQYDDAAVTAKNVTITASQKIGATSFTDVNIAVFAINGSAKVTLEDSKIVTVGDYTVAAAASKDATLSLSNTDIIHDGVGAAVVAHDNGKFEMTGGSIEAAKDEAMGISVGPRERPQASASSATFNSVSVTLDGDRAIGLSAGGLEDGRGTLSVTDSVVKTTGADATGVVVGNQSVVTLDSTRVTTEGAGAIGVLGYTGLADSQDPTTTVIRNGSQISTQDGAALATLTGTQTFTVSDSIITGRKGGALDNGVLLQATSQNGVKSERAILDASGSLLTGDVVVEEGTVSASLKNGSVLTGALIQRGAGNISELAVDGASTWRVRGDSSLQTLNNAGVVAFEAPTAGTDFKTLTVNNYVGGGTLVLNTRLGDDASPTDKLVIDGGTASGATSLRVVNAGGAGGQTQEGIRVVQTINGGTTAADAFRLDASSTGYRASSDMLSLNGYEYALMRGGNGGQAQDWYLAYDDAPVSPTTDPTGDKVTDPTGDKPTGKPSYKNVSPESGAFAANQQAGMRMFTHSLSDRVSSGTGNSGDASTAGDNANRGRSVWTRVLGRRDTGQRMAEGRVKVTTDSAAVQLGADLLKADLGKDGAVYAGLMGGYGDARVRSTSTLVRPGGATVQASTDGKVSGYSVGVYGTYYQNDATRLGAYAGTWLQWGRYDNQVNSELGSARYRATAVSASLEAGYAMTPFAPGSVLGSVVVQPHAQLTYSRYDAQDAMLQGTRMQSGNNDTLDSRIGVRVYPQATAGAPAVRPFLEANWLHTSGKPSVKMGSNVIDTKVSRNSMELKLGAEGNVGRAVQVSGHVFGQTAGSGQHGYGGMLNVGYRW